MKSKILLEDLSLRQTIMVGFLISLSLFLAVVLYTLSEMSDIKDDVVEIVDVNQPRIINSLDLASSVKAATGSLALYLLSKDETLKKEFFNSLKKSQEQIELLKERYDNSNSIGVERLQAIERDFNFLLSYRTQLLELADNDMQNYPALQYSVDVISPVAQNILQLLTQMIMSEMEETVSVKRRDILYVLSELRYAWTNYQKSTRAFLAFRNNGEITNLENYKEIIVKNEKKLEQFRDDFTLDQEDAFTQLQELRFTIYDFTDHMFDLHSGRKWRKDVYIIDNEIKPIIKRISNNLTRLVKYEHSAADLSNKKLMRNIDHGSLVILLIFVASIIPGVFVAFSSGTQMQRVTRSLKDSFAKISKGDLTSRMTTTHKGEMREIATIFNSFADSLSKNVIQIVDYAKQLSDNSEELTKISKTTKEDVQRQYYDTDTVATAMEEVVATAGEIAGSAANAADAANDAKQFAFEAAKIVEDNKSAIAILADKLKNASVISEQLDTSSQEIEAVLEVIISIAEQTNLLALNAAIEAARAGEQGRGFAVVADEVRTLAGRTQNSTAEVKESIEKIQLGSQDTVRVMQTADENAQSSVDRANNVSYALDDILKSISSIDNLNNEIAHATKQQTTGAEEMNVNISNINRISKRTLDGAEISYTKSQEVADVAEKLKTLLSNYKIS